MILYTKGRYRVEVKNNKFYVYYTTKNEPDYLNMKYNLTKHDFKELWLDLHEWLKEDRVTTYIYKNQLLQELTKALIENNIILKGEETHSITDLIDNYIAKVNGIKSMKYKVTNIDYEIAYGDVADLGNDEDEIIAEIKATLPTEFIITIEDDEDVESAIADNISDNTGWLVNSFSYALME